MKKIKSLFSFVVILIFANLALAEVGRFNPSTEPDNFRGIKWEADISTLKGMKLLTSFSGLESYVRPNDDLTMVGKIKLRNVVYTFIKGKFFFSTTGFEGEDSYLALKFLFFQIYGKGAKLSKRDLPEGVKEGYGWVGNKVGITLCYSEILGTGYFVIMYKPIYDQMVKEGLVK